MTAFHRFPDLPPELRNTIWRATLPDEVGPSLFFYRNRGCWVARRMDESEPDFIADVGELEMEFRTDLLGDDNLFQVPLVFVNREARSLALSWLDEQGIEINKLQSNQYNFTRPFDCSSDVLYVADNKSHDFFSEPSDRQGEADLLDRQVSIPQTVTRFAVSENLFTDRHLILCLLEMRVWLQVSAIFVVVGTQPDGELGPWRWKMEGADAGAFVWEQGKRDFEFLGTGTLGDEDAYRRVGEAARASLLDDLMHTPTQGSIEIRPITVTRML